MPEYKISQLILASGRKKSVCDVHISQPDSFKESLAGRVFVLVEIHSDKPQMARLKDFLIESIDRHFYQNEKIIIRERMPSITVEHIFEAALAKVNKAFADYIHEEKLRLEPNLLNIIAGVIYEDEIHAASFGKNRFLIIHKPKRNPSLQEDKDNPYRIADIFRKSGETGKLDEGKLFTNIVSGKMTDNSCFIVANEPLPEYISGSELIKIATTLPPAGAIEQVKNTLESLNSFVSFLAIIIRSNSFRNEGPQAREAAWSQGDSVANLQKIENRTEKILMPGNSFGFNKLAGLREALPGMIFKKNEKPATVLDLKDKIFMRRKGLTPAYLLNMLRNSADILLNGLAVLAGGAKRLFKTENISKIKDNFNIVAFARNLNLKSKLIFLFAVSLIVFFAINTSKKNEQNRLESERIRVAELTREIEQKQNQAEASLLYDNEKGAGAIFGEIDALIESLPRATQEDLAKYEQLKKNSSEQLLRIRKITYADVSPESISFSQIVPGAQMANLVFAGTKAYAADNAGKIVFSVNAADNIVTQSNGIPANADLRSPAVIDGKIYYLGGSSLVEVDASKMSAKELVADSPIPNQASVLGLFGSNAYFVAEGSNIFRAKKNAASIGASTVWLNAASQELSKAVDMHIDGNIYILTSDGQILKYLKGGSVEFKLDRIDPPIAAAQSFLFSMEEDNIFVFEPKERRMAIFDKKGKFKKQYIFKTDKEIRDMTFDEKSKKAFLLTSDSLLTALID